MSATGKPLPSEIEEMRKMIDLLRDDAPVFPLWTIGQLKALIDKAVKEARLDEVENIQKASVANLDLYLDDRIAQLKKGS